MGDWPHEDEPPALVKPELCLTQLTFYLDVHIIDDPAPATAALYRARAEGWVRLQRADVMDTELQGASADRAPGLLELSGQYAEVLGPMVLDHSRWDHAVLASEEDIERHSNIFKILYPGADYSTARPNHIRDAMHVHTAIRYGGSGFATRDKRLLNKYNAIAEQFNHFAIVTPEEALERVRSEALSCLKLREVRDSRNWLPTWIPE